MHRLPVPSSSSSPGRGARLARPILVAWALAALPSPGCHQHTRPEGLKPQPSAPPVTAASTTTGRFGPCDAAAPSQTITFVHVNDLHAHYNPDEKGQSPWARLRGFAEQTRGRSPYTVFTNGGDDYEKGSIAELLSKGAATREVLHAMRFDVRVLGNHDFAWGADEVARDAADPFSLVLASNVHRTGGEFAARDYAMLEVGCLKVGFFGLVSDPFNEFDVTYQGDFLPGFATTHDAIQRARELVEQHRREVQLLVMLSHLGDETDEKVVAAVPGIDVVLGAHTHKAIKSINVVKGRAIVVQAGNDASHVAKLDLRYNFAEKRVEHADYKLVENGPELPVDPEVQRVAEQALKRHAPEAQSEIARLAEKQSQEAMLVLAGRAAQSKFGAEASLVDKKTASGPMNAGTVTPQGIVASLDVQRQAPGTPGFTSFFTATVSGADLDKLRQKPGEGLRYVGPEKVDPRRTYRIVIPKVVALHPERAGDKVALGSITFAGEAWEAVDAYARARTASCLHLDRDAPLPSCTPRPPR